MASKSKTSFAIFLLLLVSVLEITTAVDVAIGGPAASEINNINIAAITHKLFKKGYGAMAVLLPQILYPYLTQPPTCNPTKVGILTIFAPTDFAFSYPMYAYHNLTTLLQFQVVPYLYLPKVAFYLDLQSGDTVDTLLPNTPLVFSKTAGGFNHVRVKEYGIYNDGLVIVHGVHQFFNPNEQIYTQRSDWTKVAGYKPCSRTSDTAPTISP